MPTTAPAISRSLFGGVLDYDGAGHYPGLELINLVFCSAGEDLLPSSEKISVTRRAHEFARRLVWDEKFAQSRLWLDVLYDDESKNAIRHLLKCLQLDIPNLKKGSEPSWERAHFFPYTYSLVHWDARIRGSRVSIERRYLRGGGALAFHVLRLDGDESRLSRVRKGFRGLFPKDQETPLERLAAVLLSHGTCDPEPVSDEIESDCHLMRDGYDDILRDGMVNILEHTELSAVARVRALMNWTAFWLVLIQHRRASERLNRSPSFIICDCGAGRPQLRRASQRCLKDLQTTILEAADLEAGAEALPRSGKNKLRGFFWASAATIKLLNAWSGRRHFTLGMDILESLVLASTSGAAEIPFDRFTDEWLFGKYSLVVGRRGAERGGLLSSFDASIFEDNERRLVTQMKAAGLLTEYSDATRMVGTGGLR